MLCAERVILMYSFFGCIRKWFSRMLAEKCHRSIGKRRCENGFNTKLCKILNQNHADKILRRTGAGECQNDESTSVEYISYS